MIEIKVKDFNLDHIFDCGQCFRWNKEEDGSYTGVAFGKAANMRFVSEEESKGCECSGGISARYRGTLYIDMLNLSEEGGDAEIKRMTEIWSDYLDLKQDYSKVKTILAAKDQVMSCAICSGHGIRILRQEPWEALISFIVSQNNNIPRIKKCIEGLCERFGEPLGEYRGKQRYAFPRAEVLANLTEEDLAPIRLGYRSKYIINTAKQVVADGGEEKLRCLRDAELQEGYDYLTSLCGVGPKVANCILLFGICKQESFPIDVWVKRVMNRLYGIDENNMKAMKCYAEETFGEHGGIAQQYLFYHIRQMDSAQ